ncbi:MAG TPA: amidase [Terriglobales bacterium]|jgi:Asp-tRNA(Asn)/Glu-tRNA(Gln) amidotransferase A subunit family amidase|nr:amidase [Terriglobales bacterium]
MLDRRHFISVCSGFGLTTTLFPGTLWALAEQKEAEQKAAEPKEPAQKDAVKKSTEQKVAITREMIDHAAAIADVHILDEYKDMMLDSLNGYVKGYDAIYALHIPNRVAPALVFDPVPAGMKLSTEWQPMQYSGMLTVDARKARVPGANDKANATAVHASGTPKNIEDVAFYSVLDLAKLLMTRKVSSTALTEMYLERLKRYDSTLKFVITLTEDRALAKAKEADSEIAAGKYRGPLHGLPWGAKDLLAVKGYRTTWGAGGFEDQTIDEDATVVQRLDAAGAVLVAKLTLGALAQGDKWFGGMTRNPWNTAQGSSGSSAGSSSATAAGCVAFAIGSETLGSISSPSTRCGVTGLRPTFGRVPRTGAMALSWTMDKLGVLCRAVEDCAIVLNAIYGPDGKDRTVRDAAFHWDAALDWRKLRIGYLKKDFELPPKPPEAQTSQSEDEKKLAPEEQEKRRKQREQDKAESDRARLRLEYDQRFNDTALAKLRSMGVNPIAVELPDLPYIAMRAILLAEAAAAFDDLTRSGRDKLLTQQSKDDWPNTFRAARFIPAVEYIQANRARMLAIEAWAKLFDQVDVIVAPTGTTQLVATNLTGHPAVIVPNGFRGEDAPVPHVRDNGDLEPGGPGTPVSLTFLGGLYDEARLLVLAKAYQDATGFHLQHPKLGA